MSRAILSREEFLLEMFGGNEFLKNAEEVSQVVNDDEVNEGLLGNLFGMLTKKDWWAPLKGDDAIKAEFKKLDDGLGGFTIMKLKYGDECQVIRQNLLDYAEELYKSKDETKKKKDAIKDIINNLSNKKGKISKENMDDAVKQIEYRKKLYDLDDEQINELKKMEKKISETASKDPALKQWTETLKDNIDVFVTKVLTGKLDEDDKGELTKKLDAIEKEKQDAAKAANEKQQAIQKTLGDKMRQDRLDALSSVGISSKINTPKPDAALKQFNGVIGSMLKVEEAFTFDALSEMIYENKQDTLSASASGRRIEKNAKKQREKSANGQGNEKNQANNSEEGKEQNESIEKLRKKFFEICKNDKMFGLSVFSSFEEDKEKFPDHYVYFVISVMNKTQSLLSNGDKIADAIKETSSMSVQALIGGLMSLTAYSLTNDDNVKEKGIGLMKRCVISDPTIGFGFPDCDIKNPETGDDKTNVCVQMINNQRNANTLKTYTETLSEVIKNTNKDVDDSKVNQIVDGIVKSIDNSKYANNMDNFLTAVVEAAQEVKKEAEEQTKKIEADKK